MYDTKYQRTITLDSGQTLTVTAWKLKHASTHQRELLNFVAVGAMLATAEADEEALGVLIEGEYVTAVQQMLEHSVTEIEKVNQVQLIDMPLIMQTLWELNQLESLLAKVEALAINLRGRLTKAQKTEMEALQNATP